MRLVRRAALKQAAPPQLSLVAWSHYPPGCWRSRPLRPRCTLAPKTTATADTVPPAAAPTPYWPFRARGLVGCAANAWASGAPSRKIPGEISAPDRSLVIVRRRWRDGSWVLQHCATARFVRQLVRRIRSPDANAIIVCFAHNGAEACAGGGEGVPLCPQRRDEAVYASRLTSRERGPRWPNTQGGPARAGAAAVPCEAALLLSPAERAQLAPLVAPLPTEFPAPTAPASGALAARQWRAVWAALPGGVSAPPGVGAASGLGPRPVRPPGREIRKRWLRSWARYSEALVGIVGEREGRAAVTATELLARSQATWPAAGPLRPTELTGSGPTEFRNRAGEKIPGTQWGGPCYSPRRCRPVFCCSARFGVVCRVSRCLGSGCLHCRFVSSIEPGNTAATDPVSTN